MVVDPKTQQDKLQHTYLQLNSQQQLIVQVFALLHEPSSRDKALRCFNQVIQTKSLKKKLVPLDSKAFSQRIIELTREDMLVQRQNHPTCSKLLQDIVIQDTIKTGSFEPIVQAIAQVDPLPKGYLPTTSYYFASEPVFLRELRIAIYRQDQSAIDQLYKDIKHAYWKPSQPYAIIFATILMNPFNLDWFNRLSPTFRQTGFHLMLTESARYGTLLTDVFDLLEADYEAGQATPESHLDYAEQLWLRGQLNGAITVLEDVSEKTWPARRCSLLGAFAFLKGQTDTALTQYRLGLKAAGKTKAAQAAWFEFPSSLLFIFALLKDGSPAALRELGEYLSSLDRQNGHWLQPLAMLAYQVVKVQLGLQERPTRVKLLTAQQREMGLAGLLEIYCLYWLGFEDLEKALPPCLVQDYQEAADAGYAWLASGIVELLTKLRPEHSTFADVAAILRDEIRAEPLMHTIEIKEAWELSLDALTNLGAPNATTASETTTTPQSSDFRMAWSLRFVSATYWHLTPLEQKFSVKGGWTKGKNIALKRLRSTHDRPTYLTLQDHKICNAMEVEYEQNYYYGAARQSFSLGSDALLAVIGHPLVFWEDNPGVRVEVVAGELELIVKRERDDRLILTLSTPVHANAAVLAWKETPTRLKVVEVKPNHQQIAAILGAKNRLEVPVQAQERVMAAITAITNLVTIQSDIGGGIAVTEVPADARPHVHLLPVGEGLKVSFLSHPFAEGGSYYPPGQGGETVIAEVAGQRLQTRRDLQEEKQRVKAVIVACPILQEIKAIEGEWHIEEPSDCLELLLQLQSLEEQILIEWPDGEKFRVSRQLGWSDFKMNIRRQQDWFAASGELQLGDDQVLDMQQLMNLLDTTPGRFLKLSDGEFVALTEEFRKRLQTLNRLTESHGKDLRINGLAALALDDVVADIEQIKVDKAWKDHLQKIKTAQTITPKLPKTLKATLRDYQQEGYTWLARLAHWGVGACLADDMGLGKTLQALAIILDRTSQGPTLVVAPTSVCMNWISEAEHFAPSLKVKVFGTGDRQDMLANAGAKDLVICSYGLLQQEDVATMLSEVVWQTIILDEAQAIKNTATKRSQAAMNLQGYLKIITTGTPIENHLGELWNLFRFINPGLLGSLERFNEQFAYPIERDQDETARDALRRLIQPFMLRRTKDQVLKELPARTEITIQVELSKEEMAFYEALRREAVAKLADSDVAAGQKHLQALAEIMRLRRACCNPSLVRPDLGLGSSKLEQFGEILEELLDNSHKALVFSQFVDHLHILQNYLEEQGIAYQYLDGSTPAKERKKRVDAFQAGEGDVFLISLKAGGTGLNLTAADYVIHMDPWWNPAVEDQASDRAHRIGQQRPVTIYRLVAKGTIEDKIVALHQVKRDLADSLLAGAEMSGKISTAELLRLIQQ
jgi:superfamily II DNA or RNA helicase